MFGPKGWYRGNQDNVCSTCLPGKYASDVASPFCLNCPAGYHTNLTSASTCSRCTSETFQDEPRQALCKFCKEGLIPNNKSTACEKPRWKVPRDCRESEQYLDDSSTNKMNWTCEECYDGADCRSFPSKSNLKPLTNYRSMTWDPYIFGKCTAPGACDYELYPDNNGCKPGHMSNVSELCRQCEIGWASASETETCDQCPERNTTIALFVMAVIGTFCLFSYLVSDSIDGAHEMIKTKESMPFHSISIRIVSSYLQVSSMLLAFDVTLPKSVRTLMYVQAKRLLRDENARGGGDCL